MPTWKQFEDEAPELAARARERLDAHGHKTIATLRKDGSPRISGTETAFEGEDIWIGSMWRALKALDLRRDPRFALHSGSDEPDEWQGDAKLAGRVEEITDPDTVERMNGHATGGEPSHLFRLDLDEVSVVSLNEAGNGIVLEIWTENGGVRRVDRR